MDATLASLLGAVLRGHRWWFGERGDPVEVRGEVDHERTARGRTERLGLRDVTVQPAHGVLDQPASFRQQLLQPLAGLVALAAAQLAEPGDPVELRAVPAAAAQVVDALPLGGRVPWRGYLHLAQIALVLLDDQLLPGDRRVHRTQLAEQPHQLQVEPCAQPPVVHLREHLRHAGKLTGSGRQAVLVDQPTREAPKNGWSSSRNTIVMD